MTVEVEKAHGYLGVARALFRRLLGNPDEGMDRREPSGMPVEDFIEIWALLHSTAVFEGHQKNVHNRLEEVLARDLDLHGRYDQLRDEPGAVVANVGVALGRLV